MDIRNYKKVDKRRINLDPITGAPRAHALGTAAGATGGAIAGAVLGSLAGPIGVAIGGTVGALTGGLAGKLVGEELGPTDVDAYWRPAYRDEPYYSEHHAYEQYAPAYRSAHAHRMANFEGSWEQAESDLKSGWERVKGSSRLQWEDAKHAARAAWHRARRPAPPEKGSALA